MKNRKVIFRILNFLLFFFLSQPLFPQQTYEGFILCVDNLGIRNQHTNEYYYIPSDYLKNNVSYNKESLEFKDDKLESKIKTSGGLKIYKNFTVVKIEDCEISEKYFDSYVETNFGLVYFHYSEEDFPTINKKYYLKKIKKNKYYLGKIRFKGCETIDRNYLKSKVEKMFIYEVDEINPVNDVEKKQLIKLIEDSYRE